MLRSKNLFFGKVLNTSAKRSLAQFAKYRRFEWPIAFSTNRQLPALIELYMALGQDLYAKFEKNCMK